MAQQRHDPTPILATQAEANERFAFGSIAARLYLVITAAVVPKVRKGVGFRWRGAILRKLIFRSKSPCGSLYWLSWVQ